MPENEGKHYPHYLGVTQFMELCFACNPLWHTFDVGYGVYLVGSALTRKDWRDVDVRHIIADDEFKRRFGKFVEPYDSNPFLRTYNLGVSAWLRQVTGLPIDYQVQPITEANRLYGPEDRNSLHFVFQRDPG